MTEKREIWQFVNHVVKLWDQLDALLQRPVVLDYDYSDASNLSRSLATNINHQVDKHFAGDRAAIRSFVNGELMTVTAARLMSDFADSSKHGAEHIRKKSRAVHAGLASYFEVAGPPWKYRFIHHRIELQHSGLGSFDFMTESAKAIQFWANKRRFHIEPLKEHQSRAKIEWKSEAALFHDPSCAVHTDKVRIAFVENNNGGTFPRFDAAADFKASIYPLSHMKRTQSAGNDGEN